VSLRGITTVSFYTTAQHDRKRIKPR